MQMKREGLLEGLAGKGEIRFIGFHLKNKKGR